MINIELFVQMRKKLGSQAKLAEAAGVSQQLIGEIETGRVRSTKAIYKIARALETAAHFLDPEIPGVEARWAKIELLLAELEEDDATYLLNRLVSDIEFAKKSAKRSKKPEH